VQPDAGVTMLLAVPVGKGIFMNCLALQSDPNRPGNSGPYFNVLNSASVYGLSLESESGCWGRHSPKLRPFRLNSELMTAVILRQADIEFDGGRLRIVIGRDPYTNEGKLEYRVERRSRKKARTKRN
jgi:hypothetical protein